MSAPATNDFSPEPFDHFLQSVSTAQYDEYSRLPDARVANPYAFEEMRAHVLDLYRDVKITESYVDEDGQILDCIPEDQHPAVRRWNGYLAAEPPAELGVPGVLGPQHLDRHEPAVGREGDLGDRKRQRQDQREGAGFRDHVPL